MKSFLIYIFSVIIGLSLFFMGYLYCDKYRPMPEPRIDYIVFSSDTVIVKGANVIDVSKVHSSKGYNDTLTGVFTTEILPYRIRDTAWLITDTLTYFIYGKQGVISFNGNYGPFINESNK